ncbi:MAG: hypothetical protein M3R06_01720, partial [Chloroflexota bacterium]|nr:hypothetical protein [Chloroflexota bacterium]
LNLTFRIGNLVGDILVADSRQAQPDVDFILSLGEIMLSRLDTGRSDTPGLSFATLRLVGDPTSADQLDAYTRLDGVTVPLVSDTAATFAERETAYSNALDVYEIRHGLNLSGDIPPYYHVTLSRYSTARLAAAAIANPPASTELTGSVETNPLPGARTFGDESLTYTYVVTHADGSQSEGFQIVARVGELVTQLEVDGLPAVPLAIVEALAERQVACMETPAERCEPVAVPTDALLLAGFTEGSAAGDSTALQPAADAGVDSNSYTSPTYGFTLTWNQAIWGVSDVVSQDGFDQLLLTNGPSSVYIEGYADGAGDPTACLTENITALREVEGVSDYTLREDSAGRPLAGGDSTRAFATYDLTYINPAGGRVGFVNFVECRALVPGESVVVVTLFVSAEDYESELPLVEDILAALTLPDDRAAATPTAVNRSFTSPTFGFRLTWGETWTPPESGASGRPDQILLDNGVSLVTISGTPRSANETSTSCVEAVAVAIGDDPRNEDLIPVTNPDGTPFGGEDPSGAYALYRFTTDDVPSVAYIECRTTEDGTGFIQILQLVPEVAYDEQITARRELLDALRP